MISKKIKNHYIIKKYKGVLDYADQHDIDLTIWIIEVFHKWKIVNVLKENIGFDYDTGLKRYRCEIEYEKP